MSDLIQLDVQRVPWEPSVQDTRLAAVYHRYDIPLMGAIEQAGADYLFVCIAGGSDLLSFWAYVHIDDQERAAFDLAADDELDDMVGQMLISRRAVVAVAAEPYGIIGFRTVGDWRTEAGLELDALLEDVDAFVDRLASAAHLAREQLPALATVPA